MADLGQDRSRTVLYRLRWDKLEESKGLFMAKTHKDRDYYHGLPRARIHRLNSRHFALPLTYLNEIHRNANRAIEEGAVYRPFDTTVREKCGKAAIAHVFEAFMLLEDCVYDKTVRGPEKYLLKHEMLLLFWANQTNRACIWERAYMDDVERNMGHDWNAGEYAEMAQSLIDDFRKQKRLMDEAAEREAARKAKGE